MQKNLNRKDGLIRGLVGLGCILAYIFSVFNDELVEIFLGVIGFILSASAFLEFCPFYYLFGIKTRGKKRQNFY